METNPAIIIFNAVKSYRVVKNKNITPHIPLRLHRHFLTSGWFFREIKMSKISMFDIYMLLMERVFTFSLILEKDFKIIEITFVWHLNLIIATRSLHYVVFLFVVFSSVIDFKPHRKYLFDLPLNLIDSQNNII